MKLNQKNVARLALPPGKLEKRFFDDDLPGFGLRLRAGGKRTWIMQYRSAGGKNQTLTIGDAGGVGRPRPRRQERPQAAGWPTYTLAAIPKLRRPNSAPALR